MPSATRRPTPSVKYLAVEPLPRPSSIPSCTSSSAFSAAALLSSSDNGLSYGLDARCDALLEAEHRVAGHEHRPARAHRKRRRLRLHSPVPFDFPPRLPGPQPADPFPP